MKILKYIFCLTLIPALAFAEEKLPAELIYNGKPIDALCISDPMGSAATGAISLASCGVDVSKDLKSSGPDAALAKKGYIGSTYTDKENPNIHAYSYYKPFGKVGDQVIVFSISSGGGSGEFTSLSVIKRNGDTIQIKNIASGDRCNSGIYDVKREKDSLSYYVNLTPFDYLTLTNDNPHNLKAYDDLDACAACCKGAALFNIKLNTPLSKETVTYVDLGDANDSASSPQKYQACFDNLVSDYKKKGMNHLSMEQLKDFTKTFNATCVKN